LWNVPIHAHRLELPYLTGQAEYPPKDPTVGGFMALLSRVFPTRTMNLGARLTSFSPYSPELARCAGRRRRSPVIGNRLTHRSGKWRNWPQSTSPAGTASRCRAARPLSNCASWPATFPLAPERGRYAKLPAHTDETGVRWLPLDVPDRLPKIAAAMGAAVLIGAVLAKRKRHGTRVPTPPSEQPSDRV
jgi:hypothetical protein